LVFHNNDDMQHNIVITAPGAANETGEKAMKLGLKGPDMQYVPNSNKVLVHSNILEPGQTEALFFVAPSVPGIYQFVCTYPGHYAAMQGVLRVTE
jgi:azurin